MSFVGTVERRASARSWLRRKTVRHANVLVAVGLVALAMYGNRDAWLDILHIARRDPESSQVFLAPIVAGWLAWVRRGRLRRHVPRSTLVGPLLIAVGWAMYEIGDANLIQSLWHLGAVVVAIGCVATALGGNLLLRFLPAVAALAFLVPVPGRVRQAIAVPLQSATAHVTQLVLDTLGANVERLGSVLNINHQEVMIAEACNGLRMVFALMIVSFAFAYGVPLRNPVRVLVVLLSPVTAIVFNVLRLVPVVWSFGTFSSSFATQIHDLSAWVMLPLSFLALLGVTRLLRWAHVPVSPYLLAHES